ncbi:hypothetical protein LOK49_LG12G02203 [Camellia lanceoleosa]|uniref:Uncharacterized protein n=1 Tax=Camellia lanceoleosa TaxID=1840588 RepID=A0ACC0FRN9_9ERIC|nr:hypothetical protein LOK49_LG12G02203 [Camellia lanceoleosa]
MLICFRSNLSDEDIFCSAKMVSNVEAAKSDLEAVRGATYTPPLLILSILDLLHQEVQIFLDMSRDRLLSPNNFYFPSVCKEHHLFVGLVSSPWKHDPIEARMKAFFGRALSTTLANITFDTMENVDELEVYPSRIPDLLSESPLIVSGRYKGDFPETLKARGILADMSNFVVDLKVQKAKDIPIDKVLAKQEIDLLTDQAWFSENKELEEKIARMSENMVLCRSIPV